MSTATTPPPALRADHGRPTLSSLTSAEILRLRSRRLIKGFLAVGLGLVLVGFVLIFRASGEPTSADLEQAAAQARVIQQECIDSLAGQADVPTPEAKAQACGGVDAEQFVTKTPFTWATEYAEGTLGIAVGFAVLLFLIGATAGGAEWSARTMPALLYWEPRRARVMGVKVLAVSLMAIVVALAAQFVWLVLAWILVLTKGASDPDPLPDRFIADTVGGIGRGVLLTVLVALAGFALANLTRNTGAALGVAFVYFAVAESAVTALAPRFVRWLVGPNIGGLIDAGGTSVPSGRESFTGADGDQAVVLLSNLRSGVVLTVIVAVLLLVATLLFSRRDVA